MQCASIHAPQGGAALALWSGACGGRWPPQKTHQNSRRPLLGGLSDAPSVRRGRPPTSRPLARARARGGAPSMEGRAMASGVCAGSNGAHSVPLHTAADRRLQAIGGVCVVRGGLCLVVEARAEVTPAARAHNTKHSAIDRPKARAAQPTRFNCAPCTSAPRRRRVLTRAQSGGSHARRLSDGGE